MQKINIAILFILFLLFQGCKTTDDAVKEDNDSQFTDGKTLGQLKNPEINEASGLEESDLNHGMLWVHNDSGDQPRIFLLNEKGEDVHVCYLQGGENRDWEDMTIGPGPEAGESYLYIAEIGDNQAVHETKYIYRLKEPLWDGQTKVQHIETFERIAFQFPDGKRDAEALMIDPNTRDLYVVSKREENVSVYVAPFPQPVDQTITLKKVVTLPLTLIVAGDISDNGQEVIMKSYDWVYYWKRKEKQDLATLLSTDPVKLPYTREPQGEAIAWKKDGTGYYTLSEEADNVKPVLYFYERKR